MFVETLSNLSWLAILTGAAAYCTLVALWYSPLLFAKPWAKRVVVLLHDEAQC